MDSGQAKTSQEQRGDKIRNCLKNLKRGLCVLGRDFRRKLYKAPFVLEFIGIIVVGAYTYQAWQANRLTRKAIEAAQRPILSVRLTSKTFIIGQHPSVPSRK